MIIWQIASPRPVPCANSSSLLNRSEYLGLLICGNAFARIGNGDLDPTFILRIIVFNQDVSLRREFCGVVYEVGNHLG